ncbi:hypothetical protein ACFW2V_13935 [Streptomyces sp. NPDC058947]|uniref:hypothetical protein n=1 Tax=Streptomyces sp. NPDC058947 TaxID=3346675 RepID=UPI00369F70F6
MTDQRWRQLHPSPDLDPGFRWDIDGRARFLHKGFVVNVLIRQATQDDVPYYRGDIQALEFSSNDVILVGTVSLDGVELSHAEFGADITDPHLMGEALISVLDEAVDDARGQVERLMRRIADIDTKSN